MEIALSRHCGPDDVITPISPKDEQLRHEVGGRGPQNHEGANNHMGARRVRRLVGPQVWRSYFKFTIERNPWDAMVSSYFFAYRNQPQRPSFSEFIAERAPELRRNSGVYRIGGRIVVDRVCRFESLHEDLEAVWKELGLPTPLDLPQAKSGIREPRHYREFYGPAEVEAVRQMHADVIEAFDYEF